MTMYTFRIPIEFDMFVYPDRTHGIYQGRNTRLHLFTKMTNFIEENLLSLEK